MKKYLDLDSDMERTLLARQYLNSNERTDRKSRSVLALFVSLFLVAFFLFFIKDRAEASEKKTAFLLTAEEEEKLSLLSEREILIGYAADSEYSVTGDGLEYGLLVPVKEFLENELDFQVEMVRQGEDRIIEGLMTGETDLAFISETKKEQSGELCSVPVYENTLFYLSNQRGKEMEAGQVIGFLGSCREEKTVRESINSSCTAVPYKDGAALAEAVEKGIVDGAVVGKVTALDLCVREGIWPKPLPQSDSMVLVSRDGRMKEVLSILDRCLLQTEEGEIFEERFFQEERNYLKFCLAKVSQGTLKKLQEKYSRILYYAGEGGDYPFYYEENGEKKGQLLRLLDFFEEASGILMEELPSHGEAEELLEEAKAKVDEEQKNLETLIASKESEINKYTGDIKNKEQAIAEYEADIAMENDTIAALEAALAEERKKLLAANGSERIIYDGGMFKWPAPSYTRISDEFGWRIHPTLGIEKFHNGIDLAAPGGSPILAAYDGEVIGAGYNSSMGNYIMINHGGGLITIYMHASALYVSNGEMVGRGEKIAAVGTTGRSTGNHLHFGVRLNGEYVNPWNYLSK